MIVVSRSRRIDWPRMIGNLRQRGMSLAQIAAAVEVSKSSIINLATTEADPAYWTGSALLVLWCDRTGLDWIDAPLRTVTPTVAEVMRQAA